MKGLLINLKEKNKKIKEKITILTGGILGTFLLGMNSVYAEGSNTGSIDSFINFACDWLTKIGGVVALVRWSDVRFRVAA